MKKSIWILLGLFIIFMLINANTSKGSLEIKGKPAINFYKDGELMWLIDRTNIYHFDLHTLQEYKDNGWKNVKKSYEVYINQANKYKYKGWRLPTKEELIRLDDKSGILDRFFTLKSFKVLRATRAIDKNIFYDIEKGDISYPTSSAAGIDKDGNPLIFFIDFDMHKYPCHFWECLNPRHGVCCDENGIRVLKQYKYGDTYLRLVRTRTKEEMQEDYKKYFLYGLGGLFVIFIGWRYRRDILEWLKDEKKDK